MRLTIVAGDFLRTLIPGKLHTWIRKRLTREIYHTHADTLIHKFTHIWMCCGVYRRRKWIRRHEFKSSMNLFRFHIKLIHFGKVRVFANGPGDLGSICRSSYQRLKIWYLMRPCLTLSIIRYGSGVKWRNPGKGVASSPKLWCSSYRKGSLRVTLDNAC